jgi:hypothetical protein
LALEIAERIKEEQQKRGTLKEDLAGERIIWPHFTQQKMMISSFICPNHCKWDNFEGIQFKIKP